MSPLEALKSAIEGWSQTRHPRFATLADLATRAALTEPRPPLGASGKAVDLAAWHAVYAKADALDVPRLFAAVGGGKSAVAAERVTLLAKWKDPRVVDGVLALLAAPPYRAQTALPFFRACAAALVASEDPRARPALEDLSARYKSILETSVGDVVASLLHRSAQSMDQVKPGPLTADLEALAARLEAKFSDARAAEVRRATTRATAARDDNALLDAIYAAPDDDGPRLVFADALTERGEVRGEFISLQLQRARGTHSRAQFSRERALLADPKQRMAFCLPLARGGRATLARGFPVALDLEPRAAKHLVGLPALRTVSELTFVQALSTKLARELLQHPTTAHVTTVGELQRAQFDGLVGALPWKEVRLHFSPTADDLSRLPRLERLSVRPLTGDAPPRGDLSRLTRFTFDGALPPGTLPLATQVRALRLAFPGAWPAFASDELRALSTLRSLEVRFLPEAAALAGLPLERLTGRLVAGLQLGPFLDALPALRHLVLPADFSGPAEVAHALVSVGARLQQLETLRFGDLHFERPFSPDATLTLQMALTMDSYFERLAEVLAVLPAGIAPRAVLKHRQPTDPSIQLVAPPTATQLARLQQANPRLPVELDWY